MLGHKTVRFKGVASPRVIGVPVTHQRRFKRLAHFIIILFRAWRLHSDKVHEMLNMYQTLHLIADTAHNNNLLFDITEYRSHKEAKTTPEVKRILQKRQTDRSQAELYFIQVALRNFKSVSEYPDYMQKGLVSRAWYQEFDAKRVLVREGHVPMHFYLILSGSAVVTMMDVEANQERTVLFLGRGDTFGEDAIISKSRRPSTVISKQKIELLALTNEDFINIFMSGGIANLSEAFLNGVSCLKGWPRFLLQKNPKKAELNFFKRGSVIVKDSRHNEWIIIVKSGSCNVLKKLKKVSPRKKKLTSTIEDWRKKLVTDLKQESYLSHEEKLQMFYQRQISHLRHINQRMRYGLLPDINVQTSEEYDEMKKLQCQSPADGRQTKSATFLTHMQNESPGKGCFIGANGKALTSISEYPLRDDEVMRAQPRSSTSDQRGRQRRPKPTVSFATESGQGETSRNASSSSIDESVFINVQTLTKGAVFGVTDLFYDDQPSFILTSSGAECILINKKFFLDNGSNDFIVRLRDETLPYPTEAELQRHLEEHVIWDHHKKQTVSSVIKEIKARRPKMKFPEKRIGFSY